MKHFKQILLILIVILVMFNTDHVIESSGINQDIQISIDGKIFVFNDEIGKPFINPNSRTMVPLRAIFEDMGYEVDWDNEKRIAYVDGNGISIHLPINSSTAIKNGIRVPIDVNDKGDEINTRSELIGNRTYVPLRFIIEGTGARITYDRVQVGNVATHKINIITVDKPGEDPRIDPGFNPVTDLMPDGRLTEEKSDYYIEKMIDGTLVSFVDGKWYFEYERPALPEGFRTGLAINVISSGPKGGISLTNGNAFLPENQLPRDASFKVQLDPERMKDAHYIKLHFGVLNAEYKYSTHLEINYAFKKGEINTVYRDKYKTNHWDTYIDIDRSRLYQGF